MAEIRIKHTDIDISGLYKAEDVEAITGISVVALRAGGYDLPQLLASLRTQEKVVTISASAEDSEDVGNLATTEEVTSDVYVKLGPLTVSVKRRWLDISNLAKSATRVATRIIEAAAEQAEFQWEEVTGESILATVNDLGGSAVFEVDRESGIVLSIQASFYEPSVPTGSLLGLVEAAATPKKIVGDLAQTSILNAAGTEEQVFGLVEWTIDWKRKTVEATTTDDATYESSLGSTKSWTAKAKFMFIDGEPSQQDAILASVDSLQLDAVNWNFFPTVEVARAVWQGLAIVDGITIASGMGKVVGLDVSLKGTGPLKRNVQIAPVANSTVTGQQAEV